jgi:hypothetical protein
MHPTPTYSINLAGEGLNQLQNDTRIFFRMASQAKLRSYRTAPKFMYGFEFPRDYQHAIDIHHRNGNTPSSLELIQLDEYKTFKGMGKTS